MFPLRDLNLDLPAADGRRIEVVANNLPIWQGAKIAVDTTIVSPLRRDGEPRPQADREPGLALRQAVDRKPRAYPELLCARRCKLVAFGVELGGRFSLSTLTFLRLFARQRAPCCAAAARQAMVHRWTTLAALAALRAHACTLLQLPVGEPVDPLDGQELARGKLLAGALGWGGDRCRPRPNARSSSGSGGGSSSSSSRSSRKRADSPRVRKKVICIHYMYTQW